MPQHLIWTLLENSLRPQSDIARNSVSGVADLLDLHLEWPNFHFSGANLIFWTKKKILLKTVLFKEENPLKVHRLKFESFSSCFWISENNALNVRGFFYFKLWDIMRWNLLRCWKHPLKDFPPKKFTLEPKFTLTLKPLAQVITL